MRDIAVTSTTPHGHSLPFPLCQSLAQPCSRGQSRSSGGSHDSSSPLLGTPWAQARDCARSILANPHSALLKLRRGSHHHHFRYLLCPSHTGLGHPALQNTNTPGGPRVIPTGSGGIAGIPDVSHPGEPGPRAHAVSPVMRTRLDEGAHRSRSTAARSPLPFLPRALGPRQPLQSHPQGPPRRGYTVPNRGCTGTHGTPGHRPIPLTPGPPL